MADKWVCFTLHIIIWKLSIFYTCSSRCLWYLQSQWYIRVLIVTAGLVCICCRYHHVTNCSQRILYLVSFESYWQHHCILCICWYHGYIMEFPVPANNWDISYWAQVSILLPFSTLVYSQWLISWFCNCLLSTTAYYFTICKALRGFYCEESRLYLLLDVGIMLKSTAEVFRFNRNLF